MPVRRGSDRTRKKNRKRVARRERRRALKEAISGNFAAAYRFSKDGKRRRLTITAPLSDQIIRSLERAITLKATARSSEEGEISLILKIKTDPPGGCKVYPVSDNKARFKFTPCPACGRVVPLTKHHHLPVSIFGANPHHIWMCRKCHDQLEVLILQEERRVAERRGLPKLSNGRFKLRKSDYFFIAARFLAQCEE